MLCSACSRFHWPPPWDCLWRHPRMHLRAVSPWWCGACSRVVVPPPCLYLASGLSFGWRFVMCVCGRTYERVRSLLVPCLCAGGGGRIQECKDWHFVPPFFFWAWAICWVSLRGPRGRDGMLMIVMNERAQRTPLGSKGAPCKR